MNLSQFYQVIDFVVNAYDRGNVEAAYQNMVSALQAQISSPSQASLENLGASLSELESSVDRAAFSDMPPTWSKLIEELGIEYYVGPVLYTWPREKINASGTILTDALLEIQKDFALFQENKRQLNAARDALVYLAYPTSTLKAGQAELVLELPRSFFEDRVEDFALRLKQFDQIVSTCAEVATGKPEKILLKELSTTDPILVALAAAPTVLLVLKVVNQVLDAYKKVVEIREIQAKTRVLELNSEITRSIDEAARKKVSDALDGCVQEIRAKYDLQNDLTEKLKLMVYRLAEMIDHGSRVEGWALPNQKSNEESDTEFFKRDKETSDTIQEIRSLGTKLRNFVGQSEQVLHLPAPIEEGRRKA